MPLEELSSRVSLFSGPEWSRALLEFGSSISGGNDPLFEVLVSSLVTAVEWLGERTTEVSFSDIMLAIVYSENSYSQLPLYRSRRDWYYSFDITEIRYKGTNAILV